VTPRRAGFASSEIAGSDSITKTTRAAAVLAVLAVFTWSQFH